MTAPLVVVDRSRPTAADLADLDLDGWTVEEGFTLPPQPWDLTDRRWFRTGSVGDDDELRAAVLAAARGVGVAVGCPDAGLRATLVDDLARVGAVTEVLRGPDPLAGLDDDQQALLRALAGGASIAEAAGELFLSPRTAERRLAAARKALGVRTTAEAIVLTMA